MTIRPVGAKLFHARGRTERQDEDNSSLWQFCESAQQRLLNLNMTLLLLTGLGSLVREEMWWTGGRVFERLAMYRDLLIYFVSGGSNGFVLFGRFRSYSRILVCFHRNRNTR